MVIWPEFIHVESTRDSSHSTTAPDVEFQFSAVVQIETLTSIIFDTFCLLSMSTTRYTEVSQAQRPRMKKFDG